MRRLQSPRVVIVAGWATPGGGAADYLVVGAGANVSSAALEAGIWIR